MRVTVVRYIMSWAHVARMAKKMKQRIWRNAGYWLEVNELTLIRARISVHDDEFEHLYSDNYPRGEKMFQVIVYREVEPKE